METMFSLKVAQEPELYLQKYSKPRPAQNGAPLKFFKYAVDIIFKLLLISESQKYQELRLRL